jgi:predicted metal-dependent phosphoesterase TrpH
VQKDFHTHTTASDGSLTPVELVARAAAAGVETLAITDHDTVAGLDALFADAGNADLPLEIVPGIEFSTTWNKLAIHIVGLNIRLDSEVLRDAVAFQQRARHERGEEIGRRLEKLGIENACEGARQYATGDQLGRPHFARHLVERGYVKDTRTAFKKYLGHGRAGDVKNCWPELPVVIDWIKQAEGVAVLAHPIDYKLSRTRLRALVADFAGAGGDAVEVALPEVDGQAMSSLAALAAEFGLAASMGSDFHSPEHRWRQLGSVPPLPAGSVPVWSLWS